MRLPIMLCCALAIAACDAQNSHEEAHVDDVAPPAQLAPMDADPVDLGPPANAMPPANAIPERYRGVWDYVEGSCAPESDLRIEVGAGAIQFYEAFGISRAIIVDEAATFVTLDMEGEGQRWQEEFLLSLSDDGSILTAHFTGNAGPNEPMKRKRCSR